MTTGTGARAVSLVPSITETLLAWGVRPVAVTRFCEAPGITIVGGTKNPDIAAIVALRPQVVLMDEEENRLEDATALQQSGVAVHATRVQSLADVPSALSGIREAVGIEAGPESIEGSDPLQPQSPVMTAWIPIWRRPWMSIGRDTYATSILAAAGIANVFGDSSDPYPLTDIDDAAARSPDVVLAPSEPYRFAERHRRELELAAPVVFVDGQDLFWWGSRTPSALGRLGQLAAGLAAR